jgi:hypothetical protein
MHIGGVEGMLHNRRDSAEFFQSLAALGTNWKNLGEFQSWSDLYTCAEVEFGSSACKLISLLVVVTVTAAESKYSYIHFISIGNRHGPVRIKTQSTPRI